MRTDTLYHILSKSIRESDNYQDAFKREVIGRCITLFLILLKDYLIMYPERYDRLDGL